MQLLKRIPAIISYFFVGGISAVTDLTIFFIFAKLLGINYLFVTIFGFFIATFVNYILSIIFVFDRGVRFKKGIEIILVYLVSSIGLAVHILVLLLLIDYFQIEKMASKVAAIGSAFIFNFLLRKYFIFKKA